MNARPQPRLRLRLKPAAESMVRAGHPWVFSESIRESSREGRAGELAIIYDRSDRFLAVGFYDPDSPLRVRIVHAGKPVEVNDSRWQERFTQARQRRAGILDAKTNACRLVHGENDGFPGLVLDQFHRVLVLKLYTAAWLPHLPLLRNLLATCAADSAVLRLSRNAEPAFSREGFRDGAILSGIEIKAPVPFLESGIVFEADVVSGQKTGFFLDQRENRRTVETLASHADVLNAFSFSGGFSLYAARGGATSVVSLDISAHALASARRNFELNQANAAIARCRHETIQANAFEWLGAEPRRQFDLVVLDPPSLAKREVERAGAVRAYEKLAASALGHVRTGGTLVAASCSAHVSADEFFSAVQRAIVKARRGFKILSTSRHAPDHPASFREAEYLKCIFLRLVS